MRNASLLVLLAASHAGAQPFQDWADKKAAALADKVLTAADAGSDASAASSPTLDSSSSAVVDRSNPGEFFSAAFNPASANGSVTVTVYSLVAALQHQSLLDPELYRRNRHLRRVSFTIGTADNGTLYGFRWRLFEGPDLFSKASGLQPLQSRLHSNNSFSKLNALMFPLAAEAAGGVPTEAAFERAYRAASPAARAQIDRLIAGWVDEDSQLAATVLDLRERLKKPRQLTLAYFTTQGTNGAADDHRLELIFDWGLHKRVDWTTNAGFEYRNVMNVGGDRRGARLASEAKIRLFEGSAPGDAAEKWVSLDLGGEWKVTTGLKPYFRSQVRLTIPLAGGVSLPIVWSHESPALRPHLRFGIEFDPAKIAGLVK